jgi:hydroxyacylglutathione hydrolase
MRVAWVRAFRDNYIYFVDAADGPDSAVVDPGDPEPVLRRLDQTGRRLAAILITHHHQDHTGGVRALQHFAPQAPVYAGARNRGRIPGQVVLLDEGAEIDVCGVRCRVIETPGHTSGHVAFFFPAEDDAGDLFSGDTIFGCTVGELFEGTPDQMFATVRKIRALPAKTSIWCAHEYTRVYAREALKIEPDNLELRRRIDRLRALEPGAPTIPLALAEERATNPFFRWDDPGLRSRLGAADDVSAFRRLCEIT